MDDGSVFVVVEKLCKMLVLMDECIFRVNVDELSICNEIIED